MADAETKDLTLSQDNEVAAKALSKQDSLLNERQTELLWRATPAKHIQQRQGRGGQTFDYVSIQYVEMYLNAMTGHDWDFKIKEWKIIETQILVLGSLTMRFGGKKGDRAEVTKEQFGSGEVKYKKDHERDPEYMVDLADDLKAAASDSLKKCASLFGVAWDVYGKDEFKPIAVKKTKIKGAANTKSEMERKIADAKARGVQPVNGAAKPTAVAPEEGATS